MISIISLVKDHSGTDLRAWIRAHNSIDCLWDLDGYEERIRLMFLAEQPEGTLSDYIRWIKAQREQPEFYRRVEQLAGRESHG